MSNKKMKKELTAFKQEYMVPQVEAMEARVERGFILSNVQTEGQSQTEDVTEAGSAIWG